MAAILYYPWFDIQVIHKLHRSDFSPRPAVDTCLLRILKHTTPLVPLFDQDLYRDFIVHEFTRERTAKFRSPQLWLKLFTRRKSHIVRGAFRYWLNSQSKLSKIHRTRTDPNWKKFH